jgi:hypothetical protein
MAKPKVECRTINAYKKHRRENKDCLDCLLFREEDGSLQLHGTSAQYARHLRKGTLPCAPCKKASKARNLDRKNAILLKTQTLEQANSVWGHYLDYYDLQRENSTFSF